MIVEEKLANLFDTLPSMSIGSGSYKPNFDFGSHDELLAYLNDKSKQTGNTYPLIWVETPFSSVGKEKLEVKANFVLATVSNKDFSNRKLIDLTFRPTLYPLLKNVKKALMQSGFTRILEQEKNVTTNFFKYNVQGEGNFATDPWDAIKFECKIEVRDCPQRTINY